MDGSAPGLKLVRQQHLDGCGVACFATIRGISYQEAMGVLHPEGRGASTSNEALIDVLQETGFDVDVRIRPDIRTLRTAVLVTRYRIGPEMFMHAVVWDANAQRVLDPFEDRPFEEYQTGLCLAFELKPRFVIPPWTKAS